MDSGPGLWPSRNDAGEDPSRRRQLEFTHRILERDALARRLAERRLIEKLASFLRSLERIVSGEHDAIVAEGRERAIERLCRTHAGRGHDEVLLDVVGGLFAKLDTVKLGTAVEPPQQIRQRLAEMAEGHLHPRETIEQAGETEPQRMRAGLKNLTPRWRAASRRPRPAPERAKADRSDGCKWLRQAPRRAPRTDRATGDRGTHRWCGR